MKYKTTRKAIVNGCANIKCAGFCDLQYLLSNHEPTTYTCGVSCGVYGVTICTGYRRMPGERLQGIEEYEHKAQTAGTPERVERILQKFCKLNGGAV